MRKTMSIACGLAFALAFASERSAAADVYDPTDVLQFGVAFSSASAQAVDRAHFIYVPVIGPWLDIGRFGTGAAIGSLVFDGICQDLVGLAFVAGVLGHPDHEPPPQVTWRVTPWFPESGGGGLSLRRTF